MDEFRYLWVCVYLERVFCIKISANMRKDIRHLYYILVALLIFPFLGWSQSLQGYTPTIQTNSERMISAQAYADRVMSEMSQEEKLAQLIMPMVWPKEDAQSVAAWERMIKKGFGGVLWQKGHPEAQLRLTNRMREKAKVPMMVAMDGEWGLSMRLSHTIEWHRNIVLGATNDVVLAERYGEAVGKEARRMGIHVNFAPVADVNNNPKNPVIGTRSFGSNPQKVAALTVAYGKGLERQGVLSVAKHFPGHGDTDVDSHKSLPVIRKSKAQLQQLELIPFERYIREGLGGIMMGHLMVPSLDRSGRAASASYAMATELLQNEMGFGGLIFTDALEMKGILSGTGGRSIAVEAFKAGNDILLAPVDPYASLRELSMGLKNREIDEAEVDRRCRKVLVWKYLLEVNVAPALSPANLLQDLQVQEHKDLLQEINRAGVTLLKNSGDLLPLGSLKNRKIALLRYGNGQVGNLIAALKQYTSVESFTLRNDASSAQRNQVYAALKKFDQVIVAITSDRATPDVGLLPLANSKPVVLTFLTSPYTALKFGAVIGASKAVVMGYETKSEAQRAVGDAIMGGIPFKGSLPVDLPPIFKEGDGLQTTKTRLSYAPPHLVGVDGGVLTKIDHIAKEGINMGAYPGCQVLVAKDGYIVYHKAFGYKDARKKEVNDTETLYDLASVTKAAATTPLVMMAKDAGRLDIGDRIGRYLGYLKGSDKEGVRISDLLFHTGGMPAVIQFYYSLIDPSSYTSPLMTYSAKSGFPIRIARNGWVRSGWRYRPELVQRDSSEHFPNRFAEGYYLSHSVRDSMRLEIRDARKSVGGYRYSDIDFLLLQDILETLYQQPLNQLFASRISEPLGAERLLYNPLNRFSKKEIAEGQRDDFLRKQTLRGDVDDEAAAMLGGVSGNAGLFGNAESLAKVLQMLLDGGQYGGAQLIDPSTVQHFTTAKHSKSPYALGFDRHRGKPNGMVAMEAPRSTYGHTGFTGTCFWIDPDNKIVYIFLSNRVAPTRWNNKLSSLDIRTRIQSVIYQSLSR